MSVFSIPDQIGYHKPGKIGLIYLLIVEAVLCLFSFLCGPFTLIFGMEASVGENFFMKSLASIVCFLLVTSITAIISGKYWDNRFFTFFFPNILACAAGILGGLFITAFLTQGPDWGLLIALHAGAAFLGSLAAMAPAMNKPLAATTFLFGFIVFSLLWVPLLFAKNRAGDEATCWLVSLVILGSIVFPRLGVGLFRACGVVVLGAAAAGGIGSYMTLRK